MGADYEVFLTYARKDGEAVHALVEALRREGLHIRFDEHDIESFQDITRASFARPPRRGTPTPG